MQGSVTQGPLLEREGWGEWQGCDAAVACEVVEHVHNPEAFAQTLLGSLRCTSLPAFYANLSCSKTYLPVTFPVSACCRGDACGN